MRITLYSDNNYWSGHIHTYYRMHFEDLIATHGDIMLALIVDCKQTHDIANNTEFLKWLRSHPIEKIELGLLGGIYEINFYFYDDSSAAQFVLENL